MLFRKRYGRKWGDVYSYWFTVISYYSENAAIVRFTIAAFCCVKLFHNCIGHDNSIYFPLSHSISTSNNNLYNLFHILNIYNHYATVHLSLRVENCLRKNYILCNLILEHHADHLHRKGNNYDNSSIYLLHIFLRFLHKTNNFANFDTFVCL